MDRDIQGNFEDLDVAEKIVGHHWVGIYKKKYVTQPRRSCITLTQNSTVTLLTP